MSRYFVTSIDGRVAHVAQTSKEWLLSLPGGAYTTARTTCARRRIFEWDTHVARTASSAREMMESDAALLQSHAALTRPESLGPRLTAMVAAAIAECAHEAEEELKVTVHVSWQPEQVACHIAPLPPLPPPPIKVEVRGAPRANATAKDSSWVAARAPLEALKRDDVNELLLASESGELLEGSQTNFFAIEGGAVHTAGDGVLAGTVRRLLLEVCERERIPVVLVPPRLAGAAAWEGALISSTSRLLLPIDELYVPAEGKRAEEGDLLRSFDNGPATLAARLRDLVRSEVDAHSTPLCL
jgi:thiol oxidase